MNDAIEIIRKFNSLAGNTDDVYNARQIALYTGLQLEELAEKMRTLARSGLAEEALGAAADYLHNLGLDFKAGFYDFEVSRAESAALLDDDVDIFVVTVGSLLSQGVDVHGAISEVNRANMDKVWPDGTMHRDASGKIVKPEGWTEPDLSPFLRTAAP